MVLWCKLNDCCFVGLGANFFGTCGQMVILQCARTLSTPFLRHTANKRAASTILARCALSDYQVIYSARACQQGWRDDFQSAHSPQRATPPNWIFITSREARMRVIIFESALLSISCMFSPPSGWLLGLCLMEMKSEGFRWMSSFQYWSLRHLFHVLSRFPEPRLITLQRTRRTM